MVTNPPYDADAPMLKKLSPLGIAPGEPFSMAGRSPEIRAVIFANVQFGAP